MRGLASNRLVTRVRRRTAATLRTVLRVTLAGLAGGAAGTDEVVRSTALAFGTAFHRGVSDRPPWRGRPMHSVWWCGLTRQPGCWPSPPVGHRFATLGHTGSAGNWT